MLLSILRFGQQIRYFCIKSGSLLKSKKYPSPTIVKKQSTSPAILPSKNSSVTEGLKDIIIFRYENPRMFTYLSFFAVTQFGFWMWISYTSLSLINVPIGAPKTENGGDGNTISKSNEDLPFYRKINLGEQKYKYGLCIGTFLMGYGVLFASWAYIVRSVRYIILQKGRKSVSIVTYGPFGKNIIMDVPIHCVSAAGSRFSGGSQIPIKVKNRRLFYILELKGDFPHPQLFDQTIGMKRSF